MASLVQKTMQIADMTAGAIPYSSKLGQSITAVANKQAGRSTTLIPPRTVNTSLLAKARINAPTAARMGSTSGAMHGPTQYGYSGAMHGPNPLPEISTPRPGGLAYQKPPPAIATPKPGGMAYKNFSPSGLAMPKPSIAGPRVAPVASLGANAGMGSIALAGAIGGGVGGYYQEGGVRGAVKGALGGAAFGAALGIAGPHAYAKAGNYAINSKQASQYTSTIVGLGRGLNTTGGRRALFASGGMLGGVAFGGDRNSRRGFNQNRGSKIGR